MGEVSAEADRTSGPIRCQRHRLHRRRSCGPWWNRCGRRAPRRKSRGRDRGQTFVEILVSIVLLGTAVGGTLTALRTTIVSTEHGADATKASVWLRGAEDALHRTPYKQCSVNTPAQIADAYRAAIQSVAPPIGWAGASINIASVQFWGRNASHVEGWLPVCTGDFVAHLVEFYVLSPTGDIGRHVQVIKGG